MLYTEVLAKYGLTKETVSHTLKTLIKRYEKISDAVADAKAKLPDAKTAAKRVNMEREIQAGEESLVALNEQICPAIDKFHANKDINAKRAQQLAESRKSKQNPPAPAPTPTPTPAPTPAPAPAPEPKPAEKKDGSALAIFGGILLAGIAAVIGFRYMNKE